MASAIPPAQKARTISHMNNDHRPDMRHIAALYPGSPPIPSSYHASSAEDPLMTDVSLSSITLRLPATDSTHVVAFVPPLASWDDRRTRLVEMARNARAALGISDDGDEEGNRKGKGKGKVVVNEYMPPRVPYDITIFLAVLFYYFTFALLQMGCFAPGTLPATVVEMVRFPYGLEGFRWLVKTIFVPVLGIHLAETWWLERSRLRKFGVRRGSAVWWLWVGSVFIEGAMAFKRFDIVVMRLREEGRKGQ
ncbi:hypothetical protein VTI74DRAFT_6128 [Chaetomium olivicolor]